MRCDEAKTLFSQDHDGMLSVDGERELADHLGTCADCCRDRQRFAAALVEIDSVFRRTAGAAVPTREFPTLPRPARALGWLQPVGFALVAVGCLFVLGRAALPETRPAGDRAGFGRSPERPGNEPALAALVHVPDCPWSAASPADLARLVSYPVIADDCLENHYELVETVVQNGIPCGESVRLTYRSQQQELHLDQHRMQEPTCCTGDEVAFGVDLVACLHSDNGGTSLSWNHDDRGFELRGQLGPQETILVASEIAASYRID